jgi:hypothetical protein
MPSSIVNKDTSKVPEGGRERGREGEWKTTTKGKERREGGREGGRETRRTSAQIEDEHGLLSALLVQAIGNGGGGGLVDDTEDVQARDGTGILGGLSLGVVEVGGHGNDGVLHLLAWIVIVQEET